MVAVKVGNYTQVVDEINSGVLGIEFLCLVYFRHYYLMLPHCPLGIVVSQTTHQLEPYCLSLVEIGLLTLYVNR